MGNGWREGALVHRCTVSFFPLFLFCFCLLNLSVMGRLGRRERIALRNGACVRLLEAQVLFAQGGKARRLVVQLLLQRHHQLLLVRQLTLQRLFPLARLGANPNKQQ